MINNADTIIVDDLGEGLDMNEPQIMGIDFQET